MISWIWFQWSSYIFHSKFCWFLLDNILPRIFQDCVSGENLSIRFLSYNDLGFNIKYILICKYYWEIPHPLQRRPCQPYVVDITNNMAVLSLMLKGVRLEEIVGHSRNEQAQILLSDNYKNHRASTYQLSYLGWWSWNILQ